MDHGDAGRQFTPETRERYAKAAEEFIAAVRLHVDLTLQMQGRQREIPPHLASSFALGDAARTFDDAEFDWCGAFPLALPDTDDEEGDEEWEDDEDNGTGSMLSVLGRWDFRITDASALVEAGRSAYLAAWPDDTRADAEVRVDDPESASSEIMHGDDVAALNEAPGLSMRQFATYVVTHEGGDDFENDPFGLIAPQQD